MDIKLVNKEHSSYHEAIQRLYGLQKYGIKFGLSKTRNLLKKFGDPQRGRRYIHIAGTNGKGSVAAFLGSILREAGLKVGLYSSPISSGLRNVSPLTVRRWIRRRPRHS
ncbi:MAG: hypothetical protein U5R49_24385 [Deltaproteobacteria bacterium]|nr:hypothetical protein [Deltaproteobacteria bacterium]